MSGTLLDVRSIRAGYGSRPVLASLSILVSAGEVVVLVGHNGAGKSTLLRAIFGLLRVEDGSVTFDGSDITNRSPALNVDAGIAFIPQGRGVFPDLSVDENLRVGGMALPRVDLDERMRGIFDVFPALARLRGRSAGTLSGGEQQMLALGRALMRRPRLILVDEPSVGLAPALASSVMRTLRDAANVSGAAVLLAEQNVREALRISDRVYVLRLGTVASETRASDLLARKDWKELFA